MGSADTRFGRIVPIDRTHPDAERLMRPNARTVSRVLFTRETLQLAESLKLLAAAWIHFTLRDWLSHGKSPNEMVRSSWLRRWAIS
jgi:Animal haem peroxidase